MPLARRKEAFDHPDWLYELKYDGFRALARVSKSRVQLISRNGNVFNQFRELSEGLARDFKNVDAVLDGEITCLDERGRSQFKDLLFRRGTPVFLAFDLLWLRGRDLRILPLERRKNELRKLLRPGCNSTIFVDHVSETGTALFELACRHDLEGIVAKSRHEGYVPGETTWYKIKNPHYSQMQGREELFSRRINGRARQFTTDGWAGCAIACVDRDNNI